MQRGSEPAPEVDPNAPRDSVLVTDADSPTGDAVVLQLILAGCGTASSSRFLDAGCAAVDLLSMIAWFAHLRVVVLTVAGPRSWMLGVLRSICSA